MYKLNDKEYNLPKLLLGMGTGYVIANALSSNSKPIFVSDLRIHHYILGLVAFFTDDEFLQGLCIGAGVEDLPDLIDDLSPQYHKLSDNIRRIQGKRKHWN